MTVRDNFNSFHPLLKLIFDMIIILVSGILVFFILLFVVAALNGNNVSDFFSAASSNGVLDIDLYKQLQTIYSISFFVVPPFIIALMFSNRPLDYLKMNKSASLSSYFFVILLVFSVIPIVNVLNNFNSAMHLPGFLSGVENKFKLWEENAKILTEKILFTATIKGLMGNLIVVALLPALGEELFFRGILQKHIAEWFKNEHWAIVVTAFLFSAFHLEFFSFLPRFFLGIVLGYLFVMSKSLWLNILAHFVNNAFAIIVAYVLLKRGMSIDSFDNVGINWVYFLCSAVVFIILFYAIMRKEKYIGK